MDFRPDRRNSCMFGGAYPPYDYNGLPMAPLEDVWTPPVPFIQKSIIDHMHNKIKIHFHTSSSAYGNNLEFIRGVISYYILDGVGYSKSTIHLIEIDGQVVAP